MPHTLASTKQPHPMADTEEVSVMVHRMERELSKLESLLDLIEASTSFYLEESGQEIISELGEIIHHCTSVLEKHQTSCTSVFAKIDQLEELDHRQLVTELLGVELGDCQKIETLLERFGFLKGKVQELKTPAPLQAY